MPETIAIERLQEFHGIVQSLGRDSMEVSLYGGEPLLNRPSLHAVLAEAARLSNNGPAVIPILNTNGTLITRKTARFFARIKTRVHLSLDGPDEKSNALRVDHRQNSSWLAGMRGLEYLKEAGCLVQLNAVVTPLNFDRLTSMVHFANEKGCDQIFLATPDGDFGFAKNDLERLADRLVQVATLAGRNGLKVYGPWAVGFRQSLIDSPWPPLNIVVDTTGAVWFPHLPHRKMSSVQDAFLSDDQELLENEWRLVLESCKGCDLLNRCNGYIRMMSTCHTGSSVHAKLQCRLARRVARRSEKILKTTIELQLRSISEDEFAICQPLYPDNTLVVSQDVIEVLSWFLSGRQLSEAGAAFSADNMVDTLATLISHRFLVPFDQDIDQLMFAYLAPDGPEKETGKVRLKSTTENDLSRLDELLPWIEAAIDSLPTFLPLPSSGFPILALPDRQAFAQAIGMTGKERHLEWMAGTVAYSLVILDLSQCERVVKHGGRTRVAGFVRNLAHEFAHLALRHAGIRLPLWLEEGLCEHLSAAPLAQVDRYSARPYIDAFIAFVKKCCDPGNDQFHHWTSLLAFSSKPIDQNPGYRLAHDFVYFISRQADLKIYLEDVHNAGLQVVQTPFPIPDSRIEGFRRPFEGLLANWRRDLLLHTRLRHHSPKPLRVIAAGSRILIFNRMVGGFLVCNAPLSDEISRLTDFNVDLSDVYYLVKNNPDHESVINYWCHTPFARRVGYHLRLSLHDGCNLRCKYCYETDKTPRRMSIATADQALTAWRNLLDSSDIESSSIRLFGGEPFLNWRVMKHVLDTATIGLPADSIQWLINTNGTLIRPEYLDTLRKKGSRLLILLSCDGVGDVHDRMRIYPNGRGSFAEVNQAVHRLARAQIPVCISATLSALNAEGLLSWVDYIAALRDQYGESISSALKPLISSDPNEAGTKRTEALFFQALKRCEALGVPIHGEMFRAWNILSTGATPTGYFCAVNRKEISVSAEGNLLMCHAIPDSVYACLDDLTKAEAIPIPKRLKDRIAGNLEGCFGCIVEGLCAGGCMAQSVAAAGHIFARPNDFFCRLIRNTFRHSAVHMLLHGTP